MRHNRIVVLPLFSVTEGIDFRLTCLAGRSSGFWEGQAWLEAKVLVELWPFMCSELND